MEIIETTEKKLRDVPVKKYKAFDGHIFDHKADCQAYERTLLIKQIPDTNKFPALNDIRPFDGGDNIEDHTYLWYFVDSAETMDKLNQAYDGIDQLKDAIGKYVCVEIDYDGYAWFSVLDDMLKYVNSILSKLHVTYDQLTKDSKEGKINHGREKRKYNIPVIPKVYDGNHKSGKIINLDNEADARYVWLIGVSSSEADGIHMERVRGTEVQIKEYLFNLVEEDRQCEPSLWEEGTNAVDQVYYPDQSHSFLYAYGSYVNCHIDYVATKEPDIINLK